MWRIGVSLAEASGLFRPIRDIWPVPNHGLLEFSERWDPYLSQLIGEELVGSHLIVGSLLLGHTARRRALVHPVGCGRSGWESGWHALGEETPQVYQWVGDPRVHRSWSL